MNKRFISFSGKIGVLALLGLGVGCGTGQIKGAFLSGEKNIWISDPGTNEVSYCVARAEGLKADPVCFEARQPTSNELKAAYRIGASARSEEPDAPPPLKSEMKSEVKLEGKPEVKPEAKSEERPESKESTKPEE